MVLSNSIEYCMALKTEYNCFLYIAYKNDKENAEKKIISDWLMCKI